MLFYSNISCWFSNWPRQMSPTSAIVGLNSSHIRWKRTQLFNSSIFYSNNSCWFKNCPLQMSPTSAIVGLNSSHIIWKRTQLFNSSIFYSNISCWFRNFPRQMNSKWQLHFLCISSVWDCSQREMKT